MYKFLFTFLINIFLGGAIFSQAHCGNGMQESLNLMTLSLSGTNVQVTANSSLAAYGANSATFGAFYVKTLVGVTVSLTNTSISGLAYSNTYPGTDLGSTSEYEFHFFTTTALMNPSVAFPVGVPVTVCTVNTTPASSGFEIIMSELYPPADLGGLYLYYKTAIQVCSANSFEDDLLGQAPNVVLPVKLKTFAAAPEGTHARLNWITSTEVNASHFDIERSGDGIDWSKVGEVKAVGNSAAETNYTYLDRSLVQLRNQITTYYYRLKSVDIDGTYEYTEIRGVNFNNNDLNQIILYPNPTNQWLNIDLSGLEIDGKNTELFIYDNSGRIVLKRNILGSGVELVNMSNFASGAYQVIVNNNGETVRQQVVKVD